MQAHEHGLADDEVVLAADDRPVGAVLALARPDQTRTGLLPGQGHERVVLAP